MAGPRLSVLQLLPALHGGGVEQGTVEVAEGLVQAGHRAIVMSAGGPMVEALERAGAEHLTWPIGRKSPLTLALVPRLARLLAREGVDILHPRSRLPAWIGYLARRSMAREARPRLVTTVHGFYRVGPYSRIMTRGERVICVSESIRDYVLAHYPATDPARLEVIHRGVDRDRFRHGFRPDAEWLAAWESAHPCVAQCRTLLLPGRITRLKGHAIFLRLIGALRARGLIVRGLIVGGEHPRRRRYAREVAAAIRALRLEPHVRMLGHRSDLREIMAVSDLVLSLSTQPESFGRTTLEALSLGRPAAGFQHGGVGEILQALYPAGRVRALDEAHLLSVAQRLLEAPPQVPAEHPFERATMIERTLDLYRRLVDSPR